MSTIGVDFAGISNNVTHIKLGKALALLNVISL